MELTRLKANSQYRPCVDEKGDNDLGKLHRLQGRWNPCYDKPEPLCLWLCGRLDVP